MTADVWVCAGSHAEANFYARQIGLAPTDWFYVRHIGTIRGRLFRPDTVLVYLPGFDQHPDFHEIAQALAVIDLTSTHQPVVSDLRRTVPDELLRNRRALMAWLEA